MHPTLFRAATALIGLHVADDSFVQPEAGTVASDHVVSGLAPLVALALAAYLYPRLRGGAQAALSLVLGVFGIAGGIEAVHYGRETGLSGDDFTGVAGLAAGLALLGLGATTLWRTRDTTGSLKRRAGRRAALGVAGVLATLLVATAGYGYVTVHVARAVVPADQLGVAHEDVRFTTADGLELRGWYIPSRNGAAVISFPGRAGSQKQARMLARHGYGVLLFDRRGEGESEGEPNAWGWGGDADAKAAIAYLQRRSDVDPDRIGAIGLSVGGEMLIETAAETDALAAVVSDGAGARSYAEDRDLDGSVLSLAAAAVKTAAVAVFSNQRPPEPLEDLAARVDEPLLLIAAPNSGHGEELNRGYAAAAPDATLWELPEASHVGGIDARPEEYERRVVGFFNAALR